jgi:DNA-binding IscR family transcriptional regulator/DNA-binding XRE family transcriptional regulator
MTRGRPPDHARRQRAANLRARGLTLAEIGRQLGVSRQAVFALINYTALPVPCGVPCSACAVLIPFPAPTATDRPGALCLGCLGRTAGATAGQRLRAYRLAAGLTRADVAWLAGVHRSAAGRAEQDQVGKDTDTLARLGRVLGLPGVPPACVLQPPPRAGYACRALVAVARGGGRGVTAEWLSAQGVAVPSAVIGPLRRAGLAKCGRGPGQGFRLARPLADMTLLDVVKAVGWSIQLQLPPVRVNGGDHLHRRLQAACDEAAEAGRAVLGAVSLADLLGGD